LLSSLCMSPVYGAFQHQLKGYGVMDRLSAQCPECLNSYEKQLRYWAVRTNLVPVSVFRLGAASLHISHTTEP
jgi:hypothetical protein